MVKRPNLIDGLNLEPGLAPEADARPADKPALVKAKSKADVQHTSVYIPRAAYERLREIAFHERAKIHDLLMEGVDRVISDRGHPERARDSAKKL